jgi:glycosyltransferase involved in cell wall biosynthesis
VRLSAFVSDFDGPAFYRVLFPFRELIKRGHEVAMPKMKVGKANKGATRLINFVDVDKPDPDADIYVFQLPRQMEHLGLVQGLQRKDRICVGEADDYDFGLPMWHPAFVALSPVNNKNYNRDWTKRIFEQCDALQVSTPFLADEYSKTINAVVRCIPNYLDWGMWEGVEPCYEVERRKTRIGWMGAAYLRKGDLEELSFIGDWLREHPDVEFVAAGSPEIHDLLNVPKAQRVSTTTVTFREGDLADITAVMDIGLVPLQRHPFNEAKSALKGMEYAACGIPCIASPSGPYREWVDDEVGRLAGTSEEWVRALDELVGDSDLRRTMGRAAREKAKRFTIQEHIGEWEDFYDSLLGTHTDRTRARLLARTVRSLGEISDATRRARNIAGQRTSGIGADAQRANPFERV